MNVGCKEDAQQRPDRYWSGERVQAAGGANVHGRAPANRFEYDVWALQATTRDTTGE